MSAEGTPLEPEEEQALRAALRSLLLNKFQIDRYIVMLNMMLAVCPIRNGQNVLVQEKDGSPKVARWTINMPHDPIVPPPGGTAAPINQQVFRRAA